jgi:hypothetical protein
MSATRKQRHEFIGLVYEHVTNAPDWPGMPRQFFAERMMGYAATLHRLAEEQCNGYQDFRGNWDEKATERSERKEKRIHSEVTELCKEFGCTPHFGGDPRGCVLVITVPDGYTNDWERRGICVPTS